MKYISVAAYISLLAVLFSVILSHYRKLPSLFVSVLKAFPSKATNISTRAMSTVPSNHPYYKEFEIASIAVRRASVLTKKLSDSIAGTKTSGTHTKDDKSPVTVGDYAAQAIINHAIKLNFPDDEIVGEEDSDTLREGSDESKSLSSKILEIITDVQSQTSQYNDRLGKLNDTEEIYNSIDLGNSQGGSKGRFWALDPIDGTKGFLRGDQFAVCLALIENGKVILGVIGCPNLPAQIVSNEDMSGRKGGLFSAIKGVGSFYTDLFESQDFTPLSEQESIKMSQNTTPETLKVVEGVEKGHSSHSTQSQIKDRLGFKSETVGKQTINLDSQVKYCVLAKGQADIYLRLPINDTYREKIWDHAAGNILVYESGGFVGDIHGNELNFGNGRLLNSQGVVAGNKSIFKKVIEAVGDVLKTDS